MRKVLLYLALLLGLTLSPSLLTGCDHSDSSVDSGNRLRVLLTDAAPDDIVEANVIIERVELLGNDERVILLADEPQPFDLLTLQDGVTAVLADLDIPDGTYNQVRVLVHDEASVVFEDGTVENLKVPGGSQSGIKLNLPALDLNGDVVEVTIDFDVSQSFVRRGNSGKGYIFKPVLHPVALRINGEPVDLEDDPGTGEESRSS